MVVGRVLVAPRGRCRRVVARLVGSPCPTRPRRARARHVFARLLFGLALPLRSLGGHKGAGNPFEYARALHTKQRKDEKLLPQNIRYGASATWGDSQKRTEPLSLHIREAFALDMLRRSHALTILLRYCHFCCCALPSLH